MATSLTTLGDLLPPDRRGVDVPEFAPCARYYAPMDYVLYLEEDLSYRADRIDEFLTLLWHPQEDRAIGLKIKGFRFLFDRLRKIACAAKMDISEAHFFPLVAAIELALTVQEGASLTAEVEQGRESENEQLNYRYATARQLVRSVQFNSREMTEAA